VIQETIVLEGHIIDSLTLTRVMDLIIELDGDYHVDDFAIGRTRHETSRAVITVRAEDPATLDRILGELERHGATAQEADAPLAACDKDGVYPEGFYSTTNMQTYVRIEGKWLEVRGIEMDCGVRVREEAGATIAECVTFQDVHVGDRLVVGHEGIRVTQAAVARSQDDFGFMTTDISTERPKRLIIRRVAEYMRATREQGRKILFVGGPAIIHSGAGPLLERLVREGWIDRLHAGNALATHDIESQLFGTSLGVGLERGAPFRHGHQHHLRAINTIRRAGSIRAAVEEGVLSKGIMHACVTCRVPFVLAGSIRDDGPLPDVVTDILDVQKRMRELVKGVGMAILVATTLHSVAIGNMLPADVRTICVDSDADTVIKLADRGTHQVVGLVTDCEYFLRELVACLTEGQ
jgi:lysine-ketoglutarate reductase/saccharopine dehydrogenase-like protein (TIGR00300 family)